MKTILVDAVGTFVEAGTGIFQQMYDLLETYPNPKIILTGANDEQMDEFGLHNLPYELFTLKHNPEKSDPEYYRIMLEHYRLSAADVVYFEHSEKAKQSVDKKDLDALKKFLDKYSVESK